uniref:Ubiquitin thioesterase OTU n=1 Tax=Hirondellea gigas TaxID=1518452 RepID=A0A6A7FM20_9CRUS
MQFRCRHPTGQFVLHLPVDTTFYELQLKVKEECGWNAVQIKSGYPPSIIEGDPSKTLQSLGICSGNLILEKREHMEPQSTPETKLQNSSAIQKSSQSSDTTNAIVNQQSQSSQSHSQNSSHKNVDKKYDDFTMIRRVIPSDNSCLFAAVLYAMEKTRDSNNIFELRQIIASVVLSDPQTYTEGLLGKPNTAYAQWIMNPERWGGSIELSILSSYYEIEIAAIDIVTLKMHCFGENNKLGKRMYLIYDGIHYDTLVLVPHGNAPESSDVCIVSSEDSVAAAKAMQVVYQAQQNREFTDVHNFTLRCSDCSLGLKGQKEAQQHAQETGHVNFSEY